PVCNYDFYPTLMDLVKAKPNKQAFDGVSIASILKNPRTKSPERAFYWHYPLENPHFLGGRSAGSIRKGDWKLIQFFDDKTIELYNLKDDAGEEKNLANNNPKKVKELIGDLQTWRKDVGVEEKY